MSEIDDDKVSGLVMDLCNRAIGQLPEGSRVTMAVRLPPKEGERTEFLITNEDDPTAVAGLLFKIRADNHPSRDSISRLPIEPVRGPITHDPDCPDCKEA